MLAYCMRHSRTRLLVIVSMALALALSSFSARAQMYPQDIHSQKRWTGAASSQPSFGLAGMGVDSASEFLQRREEEVRERREALERQRRMTESFTNIPDQLRETYPRRADAAYNWR